MCQNKPRPIRIKALKRSLMPFKVPLNWWADNMSSVEAAAEWGDWSSLLRFGALPSPHTPPFPLFILIKPWKYTYTLFSSSHILCRTRHSQVSVSVCAFCAALLRTLAADDLAQCPCCIWTVIQNQLKTMAFFFFFKLSSSPEDTQAMSKAAAGCRAKEMWRTGINAVPCYSKATSCWKLF